MKPKKNKLIAIDFFCGGGGMTCGFSQAGIQVVAGIDIDKNCKETYEYNNPSSKFIQADITKLKSADLAKKIKIKKNDDSLVFIGCSPCQYWSIINTNKKKSASTKDLIKDFERFVNYYRPGYVVVENVPGIMSKKKNLESLLPQFISFLEKLGYKVDYKIIKVSQYDVPQKRRRFLLLASRVNKKIVIPSRNPKSLPTVRDFIGHNNGFQKITAGHKDLTDFLHTSAALSKKNLKRISLTPKNGGTASSWPKKLKNASQIRHKGSFRDVYGRIKWNEPAPTITTRFISLSNGRFGHPEENRAISLREGATLQTFPKEYVFKSKNIGTIAKLIGNAVPPKFAEIIAKSIITQHLNNENRI